MTPGDDWLDTRFCREFGVRYPIVQTGMGWVSGARLTAATSNAGGLGILAAVTLEEDAMTAAVRRVRSRTEQPFGVNLRPDQPDLPRRLDVLAEERVPVVSFAGGPPAKVIRRVHEAGLKCVVTVGKPRHAEKMLEAGADALLAQGGEGGGHTGDIATTQLLPAVLDIAAGSDSPVLAAGGFYDGRGLAAAIVWGADGVAMGTRFLLTAESRVPDATKQRYLAAGLSDTVRSDAFDGMPMRVLRSEAVAALEQKSWWRRLVEAPAQAAQVRRITGQSWVDVAREGLSLRRREGLDLARTARAAQAPLLIRSALVEGDPEHGLLPTGQVAGNLTDLPTVAELIERMVVEARAAAHRAGR
jgi:NAD(P)H-dependent flavin oxidoreductase YrpB (nitropropane dioxygenase family)